MLLKEIVKLAKNGNEYYKECLYERYLYVAKRIFEKYQEDITFVEVLEIYKDLLDSYCKENSPIGISAYLVSQFGIVFNKKYKQPRELITETIAKAKNGDKSSRDKLIVHYSYIVERIAKGYNYMENEDLVQCGMEKLITIIDNELLNGDGSLFSPRIIKYMEFYFNTTLKNEVESEKIECEYDYIFTKDNFDDKVFKIELEDLINSKNITKKDKLFALKYFVEDLSIMQVGQVCNCSKQNVSLHINKVAQKIKSDYKK